LQQVRRARRRMAEPIPPGAIYPDPTALQPLHFVDIEVSGGPRLPFEPAPFVGTGPRIWRVNLDAPEGKGITG